MYINEIKELPNKRRRVILDDESSLTLYAGELRKYGMKTGEEVPEAAMDEIMNETDIHFIDNPDDPKAYKHFKKKNRLAALERKKNTGQ